MKINGMQVVDEMLRSPRRIVVPVVLLAATAMVGCGAENDCKDACDGTQQEIEACQAVCDGTNL